MRNAFLAVALLATLAADASAQSGPEVSLLGGFGSGVRVNRGNNEELLLVAQPQVAFRLGSRFEWLVEAHFAAYFRPDAWAAGLVPISARYLFSKSRVQPYFGVGAGFGWTNLEVEEIDRRFNFILQGGFGVRKRLDSRRSWSLEARWLHYSNAGTALPNLGFNTVVLLGGWRLF